MINAFLCVFEMSLGWYAQSTGLIILFVIMRRVFVGSEPISILVVGVGVVAMFANVYCLKLIDKYKHDEDI